MSRERPFCLNRKIHDRLPFSTYLEVQPAAISVHAALLYIGDLHRGELVNLLRHEFDSREDKNRTEPVLPILVPIPLRRLLTNPGGRMHSLARL